MRVFMICLLVSCFAMRAAAQNVPGSPAADVVHYKGTIDNVKYVFGVAPPVARLRPGNILDANSLDCFGNGIQKPGDTTAMAKGDNPLTGPFLSREQSQETRSSCGSSTCKLTAIKG